MNEKNSASTGLGWVTMGLLVTAAILWGVGVGAQRDAYYSDELAGLWQLAAAGALFQLGAIAGIVWLAVRAVIAQMAYKAPPTLTQRDAERAS